jgi:hypothetical protein
MNVVMDDATEVYTKDDRASVPLGAPIFLLLGVVTDHVQAEFSLKARTSR